MPDFDLNKAIAESNARYDENLKLLALQKYDEKMDRLAEQRSKFAEELERHLPQELIEGLGFNYHGVSADQNKYGIIAEFEADGVKFSVACNQSSDDKYDAEWLLWATELDAGLWTPDVWSESKTFSDLNDNFLLFFIDEALKSYRRKLEQREQVQSTNEDPANPPVIKRQSPGYLTAVGLRLLSSVKHLAEWVAEAADSLIKKLDER
jgi:hypothetical protein